MVHNQGDFSGNKITGFGTMRDQKGDKIYEGEWKDNLKHGVGTLAEKGRLYKGYFEKDKKHGKGVILNLETKLETVSEWQNDQLVPNTPLS